MAGLLALHSLGCWCSTARHGLARHGAGWHGTGRCRMAQHIVTWHGTAWHGTAWLNMAWQSRTVSRNRFFTEARHSGAGPGGCPLEPPTVRGGLEVSGQPHKTSCSPWKMNARDKTSPRTGGVLVLTSASAAQPQKLTGMSPSSSPRHWSWHTLGLSGLPKPAVPAGAGWVLLVHVRRPRQARGSATSHPSLSPCPRACDLLIPQGYFV